MAVILGDKHNGGNTDKENANGEYQHVEDIVKGRLAKALNIVNVQKQHRGQKHAKHQLIHYTGDGEGKYPEPSEQITDTHQ